MAQSIEGELDRLMVLSRDSSKAARRRLFENMSGLFLAKEDHLNEQERAHISDILSKLVSEVETSVRRTLSERLAASGKVPHELVKLLANDSIEVARPLLFQSRVLMEPDLMEIIESRSKEHLLVVAERNDINIHLSDLLIEFGDEDVIEGLIKNGDAEISREAMAFLVEESKRIDRFQEPLLIRQDLPGELAHKMFWWVSAALRRYIIDHFEVDEYFLDQHISGATEDYHNEPAATAFGETHADRLVAQLAAKNELTERFLIQSLKGRQIRLFVSGLSLKSGLDTPKINRFLHERNAEAMAVTCRALEFDRNSFSAVFLLTRREKDGAEGKQSSSPEEIEAVMQFYDQLTPGKARKVLEHWKLATGYSEAIEQLDHKLDDQRVYL
ncbi:MAG: DUF2336 domain-containing protein [Sneathiella sp.]